MTDFYTIELQDKTYFIYDGMVEALERYVNQGVPTGDFLRAVLANDFIAACQRADHWNLPNLPAYAAYIYNEIPSQCHGSYAAVDAWIERGGLNGIKTTDQDRRQIPDE